MHLKYPNNHRLVLSVALWLAAALPIFAQAGGTVSGHVYNHVNKEYVIDANVRVEDTPLATVTESGGYFSLRHVPTGTVKVTVSYAGLPPVSAVLAVSEGETVTHEFELGQAVLATDADGDPNVVKLDAFVINSEQDGGAKALQRQRNSMNMSRSVSSDAFGNVTEGNVGEFLKFLPGVELEYVEADTRGPRIGGMSSEYASVTLDGKNIAAADSFGQYVGFENSSKGSANRSFGFDSISINSIESIELNRVTSAAMDASAPAGNINLKAKKAFDRKGRQISASFATVLNSDEFTLHKTVGPDDRAGYKFRPNYSLNYSDVFFGKRLGIVLSLQESNLYNEQYRIDHTYDRKPTAADPRPQVLTKVLLKDGPKWTERTSYSGTVDFRASDNLSLSLTALYSWYHAEFYNRQVTMLAGGTRADVPGDGVEAYGSSTASSGSIQFGGGDGVKLTNTLTLSPSFDYRRGNLAIDGSFTWSHSYNDYDNLAHGVTNSSDVNEVKGLGFTATRSNPNAVDWRITQTAGPDWTDLSLGKNPRISDYNRQNEIDIKSGSVNAKYTLPFKRPSFIQVGVKQTRNAQSAANTNDLDKWLYVGPGGGTTGSFAEYPSPFVLFGGKNQPDITFTSIGGGGAPTFPDRNTLGELFATHPEYFEHTLPTSASGSSSAGISLSNYESGTYLNNPTYDITETISAAYLMGQTRFEKLTLQGGVRLERTAVDGKELDPYSNQEVAAAGYAVTSSGAPNSVEAIDYKYSRPLVVRHGDYDDLFPSITAKYLFIPKLMGDIGWGQTIRRPNFGNISGPRQIDDENLTVRSPNPNLAPEQSSKVAASLSYFFGDAGINNVQVVATNNRIVDKTIGYTLTSDEFGNTDPSLDGYDFISYATATDPVTYKSMEYSYTQYLSFLPPVLQGTSLTASYTRTYVDSTQTIYGVIPHTLKTTLSYGAGRVHGSFSAIWQDDSGPYLGSSNRYQKANTKCDLSLNVRLTENVSFYCSGRNIFEKPHLIMERGGTGNPDVLYRYENYGTNWTFGVRGKF